MLGIQKNHEDVQEAKKGEDVAVKIGMEKYEHGIVYGRQFDHTCQLVRRREESAQERRKLRLLLELYVSLSDTLLHVFAVCVCR